MNKEDFGKLFQQALEQAANNVEKQYHTTVPRHFRVAFHGFGYNGNVIDVEEALEYLYLGENLFLALVDVAVIAANSEFTTVFVRVSGFPNKTTIEETWNDPVGSGPFKQIISLQFKFSNSS